MNTSVGAKNGSHPIRIVATDTAGNTAEADTNTLQVGTCIPDAVSGDDDEISLSEILINVWAEGRAVSC